MPACSEKPELSATSRRGASGSAGSVCSVNTFWPSRGPVAIRYVIEAPSSALIGASSPGSNARYAFSMSRVMSPERSSERPIRQYFLEEYTPNGRLAEFDDNGLCVRAWTDPRVKKAEARVGPNGQIAALRAQGVPVDQLVKVGAGFGLGSICFASLA